MEKLIYQLMGVKKEHGCKKDRGLQKRMMGFPRGVPV